ncbi:MAG: hypothetical protein J7L71_00290 [Spirochaetaceae bacterium]|nr:hypothetical protein [Spirochaetaceae bacterium]
MKNVLLLTIYLLIISGTAFAVESTTYFGAAGAYYFDDNKGFGLSDGDFAPVSYSPKEKEAPTDADRALGSGWGGAEAKASITHKIKVPFMQGTGALSSGNNVLFQLKGELSPVSINAGASATITPIAFLNFQAGTQFGTGWNFFGLFNGLGLNNDGNPLETNIPGIVSKSWLSGTFQFDIGAVVPGEWTHVIMAATAKAEYQYFSGADEGDAWQYEADAGENFNGFSFLGSYVLGYQLPFMVNTVAFMVETEQMLGDNKDMSTSDPIDWGSDFTQITFGPLANIQLSKDSSLLILVQFRNEKLVSNGTIYNNYFKNREQTGSYIDFRRIAFAYSKKLE